MTRKKLAVYVEAGLQTDTRPFLEILDWADAIFLERGIALSSEVQLSKAIEMVDTIPRPDSEWLLHIFSDEWISDELRQEIEEKVLYGLPTVDRYRIPSRSLFMGKWLPGTFFHDISDIRLVRTGGRCRTVGEISEAIEQHLPVALRDVVSALSNYSAREAAKTRRSDNFRGTRNGLVSPLAVLGQSLLKRGLWRAGYPGLVLAVLSSFLECLVCARQWELDQQEKKNDQ